MHSKYYLIKLANRTNGDYFAIAQCKYKVLEYKHMKLNEFVVYTYCKH